jgi:hypothetical protein
MGLERLPSGKFDTKDLVCQMACVAMNLLRLIGTHTLHGKHAPVRHAAQRRPIRTVMQERTVKAARLIRHAGRWVLGLGEHDSGAEVFAQHDGQLVTTSQPATHAGRQPRPEPDSLSSPPMRTTPQGPVPASGQNRGARARQTPRIGPASWPKPSERTRIRARTTPLSTGTRSPPPA